MNCGIVWSCSRLDTVDWLMSSEDDDINFNPVPSFSSEHRIYRGLRLDGRLPRSLASCTVLKRESLPLRKRLRALPDGLALATQRLIVYTGVSDSIARSKHEPLTQDGNISRPCRYHHEIQLNFIPILIWIAPSLSLLGESFVGVTLQILKPAEKHRSAW